jgi:hypothetical protein
VLAELELDGRKETLHHGIVVAVAATAHTSVSTISARGRPIFTMSR